ncbi:MAG: HK97 family phage prohead protease [Ilumatobacteraceae bacterium]
MLRMIADAVTLDAAAGDDQPRTISGIAVPYNVEATVLGGTRVRILQGALPVDGPAPRLLEDHDTGRVVGKVVAREDTSDGMLFTAEIARTRSGDDLVELLKMGALDSVSVGIEATDSEYDDGTLVVKAARWDELSVVYRPAFSGAQITKIAAAEPEAHPDTDQTPEEEQEMTEENTVEVEKVEAADAQPTTPIYAMAKREFKLPSASEWIAAAMEGGHRFAQMNENIRAAAPDVTTANNDGVLPEPIVGPVYNNYLSRRPVIDAFGVRALPAGGKVFIRPSVSTHTSVGVQSSELATLQSGEFQVQENSVTKQSAGGYVTVSEQVADWSQPEIISLILEDMGRVYSQHTDNAAADAFVAGATTTGNFTAASKTDATEWLSWLYANAAYILENAGNGGHLPTHLFLSAQNWEALGKLEDGQGRPLFPTVGPMNAFGSMTPGSTGMTAFGLQVVVDTNFDNTGDGTMILGDTIGFEYYEQNKGFLRVQNAQIRGTDISWLGYYATLMLDADRYVKAAFV